MSDYLRRLDAASRTAQSLVCVGLDPDPALMPAPDALRFNQAIVDATCDLVCAYKLNLAFYEALGLAGMEALEGTIAHIRSVAPGVVIVGDGKRSDVEPSNARYAHAMFEVWGFDAATVTAYGGGESLEPFFQFRDRGVYVWCRSSNPGASELQDVQVVVGGNQERLYQRVAHLATTWNTRGNVGLVVGATYPQELADVRRICPDLPILVPGVGAQGGDLDAAVKAGMNAQGRGLLVSSSRGIIYASTSSDRYAGAARAAARELGDRVNRILRQEGKGW